MRDICWTSIPTIQIDRPRSYIRLGARRRTTQCINVPKEYTFLTVEHDRKSTILDNNTTGVERRRSDHSNELPWTCGMLNTSNLRAPTTRI